MSVCIPKEISANIKQALKNGELSIKKLVQMDSDTRRGIFESYLKDKGLAKKLNIGFEQRMNSKTKGILNKYILREMDKVKPARKKELVEQVIGLEYKTELNIALAKKERLIKKYGSFNLIPKKTKEKLIEEINKFSNQPMSINILNPQQGKPFLSDLAEQKLGTKLTQEEAQTLYRYADESKKAKDVLQEAGNVPKDSTLRTEFALKELALTKYAEELFVSRKNSVIDNFAKANNAEGGWYKTALFTRAIGLLITDTLGSVLKGALASVDNGFHGRQGIAPLLQGDVKKWADNIATSFKRIPGAIRDSGAIKPEDLSKWDRWFNVSRGTPMMDLELIELYKSNNYINGVYQKAPNAYGMDVLSRGEEAFPPSFLAGLRGWGRFHRVSEDLYNSSAIRIRRKMADDIIEKAKLWGLDPMDPDTAKILGEGIGSLTGRASLGQLESAANLLNTVAFSARLFKATTDKYWHVARGIFFADDKAKRLVAVENLKVWRGIVGFALSIYAMQQLAGKETVSIDLQPTSATFGFITVGGSQPIDMFGGIPTIARTFARAFSEKYYDPKLGVMRDRNWWENGSDELINFIEAKKSPLLSFYGTLLNGEHFGGEPVTPQTMVSNFLVPITIQSVWESGYKKEDYSSAMQFMMFEGLGFGTRDMRWNPAGADWKALRAADEKKYWEAVVELGDEMDVLIKEWRDSDEYQNMTEEERAKMATSALEKARNRVIDNYSDFIPEAED